MSSEGLQLAEKLSQSRLLEPPGVANSRPAFEIEDEDEDEDEEKSLQEALAAKKESLRQLKKEFRDYLDKQQLELHHRRAERDKLERLRAELKERNEWCEAESAKLDKLESEIQQKWDHLIDYLETCHQNSKITNDVKPFLRLHYDSYMKTLDWGGDDHTMLNKYVRFFLQPSSAQKINNEMFAGLDFMSPIYAAASKVFNFFLGRRKERCLPTEYLGETVDNECEHPGEASIGQKLWDFIIT